MLCQTLAVKGPLSSELTNKLRRYHDNHQDQNIIKCGRKSETEAISDLELTSLSGTNVWIKLPVSYTRENLPVGGEDIATPDKIRDWKNLGRIAHKIIQVKISVLVFLLVAIVPRHWNHWKTSHQIWWSLCFHHSAGMVQLVLLVKLIPVQKYHVTGYQFRKWPLKLQHHNTLEWKLKQKMLESNRCFIGCTSS